MQTRREEIKRRTLRKRKGLHRLQCREYNQREKSLFKIWKYGPKGLTTNSEKAVFPCPLELRKRSEQVLLAVIQETTIPGILTCMVNALV